LERTGNSKNKSLSRTIKFSSRIFQISQFKLSFKCQCQISVSGSYCLFYYYCCCLPWKKSIHNTLFLKIRSKMLICLSIYLLYCFYCNLSLRNRHYI